MPRHNGYSVESPCGTYRWELGGDIGPNEPLLRTAESAVRMILWIMLNPSTANAAKDDQTLKTIVTFSEIWGYTRILVGNLYAYRATRPEDLHAAMKAGKDVVGNPQNNIILTQMIDRIRRSRGEVMAAWGGNAKLERVKEVVSIVSIGGDMPLKCLRVNGDGSPVHPLYQPHDLLPTVWPGMAA